MSILKKWWFHASILAILVLLSYFLWKSVGSGKQQEAAEAYKGVAFTVTDFETMPTEQLPKAVFWLSTAGEINRNQAEAMLYDHLRDNNGRYSNVYYNIYFGKRKDGSKKSPYTGDRPDMEYTWDGEFLRPAGQ